jgi:hypothetical protein
MVLDQIVWIGTASYDFQHVRTRRGTKVKSSCVDSIDKRFVSDCVEQACVADIDVHGVSHIKSLEEVKGHIVGLVLFRPTVDKPAVAFGEQRVMSI